MFRNNSAKLGGALAASGLDTTVRLQDCHFLSNHAEGVTCCLCCLLYHPTHSHWLCEPSSGVGGAIHSTSATRVVSNDNQFSNNTASMGGAIASSGQFLLQSARMQANVAAVAGGALFATARAVVTMRQPVVVSSSAGVLGGFIHADKVSVCILVCRISDVFLFRFVSSVVTFVLSCLFLLVRLTLALWCAHPTERKCVGRGWIDSKHAQRCIRWRRCCCREQCSGLARRHCFRCVCSASRRFVLGG